MKRLPHVKNIVYETDGVNESIKALVFRSWEHPNSLEVIEFNCAKLGYLLASLLNLDLSVISNRVTDGYLNRNLNIAYLDLVKLSDVFKLYISDEVSAIYNDFGHTSEGTMLTISRVRQYIDFCEHIQQPYHSKFFDYLHYHGYFGVSAEIFPVNGVEEMEAPSDGDIANSNQSSNLSSWYKVFLENSRSKSPNISKYNVDATNRLGEILVITLCEMGKNGYVIRKCGNCGRYFIPENRSDTVYCNNISPQYSEMTCRQYGSQRLWYDRQKDDDLATLSRNILSAKSMLAKRNPDIPEYTRAYDYFRSERLRWKREVKEGRKSRDAYREWLLSMRSQKIIKEEHSIGIETIIP